MKIYTKGGDAGQTSLFDGARVSKAHARVAACGDVDELNACVGMARALAGDPCVKDLADVLEAVQRDLFGLGALLADPRRDAGTSAGSSRPSRSAFDEGAAAALEPIIDRWEEELPRLTNFVLPGGSPLAAALHVARTVGRRAERRVVATVAAGSGHPVAIVYLNRLSDLLFVATRIANRRLGVEDVIWSG